MPAAAVSRTYLHRLHRLFKSMRFELICQDAGSSTCFPLRTLVQTQLLEACISSFRVCILRLHPANLSQGDLQVSKALPDQSERPPQPLCIDSDIMGKRWLPLESNPTVLNDFAARIGFNDRNYRFCDVFGLDPVSLCTFLVPKENTACHALCL